ncbi:MAG: 6-carboxytetrahydropterin synthase, partial [Oleibacter sp.]|nr:6-carboxytetrahydropterin synthase [Thalassolituus sp.]
YLDFERGLVGETWWASAILEGAMDEQGMVCDFGTVKKVLRTWLDNELDHRLLVPRFAPGITIQENQDSIYLFWSTAVGNIEMTAPTQAVTLIDSAYIDSDSVAQWSIQQLHHHFPDTIDQLTLDFIAENIKGEFYHYSHGLKKHNGNCQRIAHGHRSRIQIWLNGDRSEDEESYWANLWQDIYIGSREDLTNQNDHSMTFKYRAQQGDFTLSVPTKKCYMMETDTTVEFIASHLASAIKNRYPDASVTVRAFEGVNKGAMASI